VNPEPSALTGAEAPRGDNLLSLQAILQVIRRRWFWVALVVLLLVGTALVRSYLETPIYQASIKILIGQELGDPDRPSSLTGDVQGLQQFTRTAAGVVQTRPVAEGVIQELNLDMTPEAFLGNLSVEPVAETQIIQVNYTDSDPQRAKQIADTIGEVFSKQVSEVSPNANSITATLWERAIVPEVPISPNPQRSAFLALVLGMIGGVGLALFLEYSDDSWRSPEEVEQISGLPTFGVIPQYKVSRPKAKKGKDK